MARIGPLVRPIDAAVGDYLCLTRRLPWQGHGQRIVRVRQPGIVDTIDGNVGSYRRTRGAVRRVEHVDLGELWALNKLVGIARYY